MTPDPGDDPRHNPPPAPGASAQIFAAAARLHGQGRLPDAERLYRALLESEPGHFGARHNLGLIAAQHGDFAAAAQCFRQALDLDPAAAEAHSNLGNALFFLGRVDEAVTSCERAIALRPDYAEAHNNLGTALRAINRPADALRQFEIALALRPGKMLYFRHLAECKRFRPGDPHLAAMEALAASPAPPVGEEAMHLHFALAKAYDDLDQRERGFGHLIAGNALKRARVVYDEAATLRALDRTPAIFSAARMSAWSGAGDASAAPIFILGMPRSGSTLVEQILASHPAIFGGGELMAMERALARVTAAQGGLAAFPDSAGAFTGDDLRRLAAEYRAALPPIAPTATRMTDKQPGNFRWLGLLHLALPNARFIHTRRDPLDTCLSCFSKLFTGAQPYSYDFAELGRYYRAYERLMAHWRRVLPAGVMLDLSYEEVVADLEGQARRILAHCGLDWDPACLAFQETARPILTASATQVREPIHDRSIGRWTECRPLYQPLIDALANG